MSSLLVEVVLDSFKVEVEVDDEFNLDRDEQKFGIGIGISIVVLESLIIGFGNEELVGSEARTEPGTGTGTGTGTDDEGNDVVVVDAIESG